MTDKGKEVRRIETEADVEAAVERILDMTRRPHEKNRREAGAGTNKKAV